MSLSLVAAGLFARDVRADDLSAKKACVDVHERAQELRQAGHLVAARDQLTTCSETPCPALIRTDCAQWLLEVDGIMPTIVLGARDAAGADLADVKVTCDGREIATRLDGRVVPIDPGEHVLHFEHDGSPPSTATSSCVRASGRGRWWPTSRRPRRRHAPSPRTSLEALRSAPSVRSRSSASAVW